MLRLNDDCLCHIFDRLEIRDQITLTAVCERFSDIIVSVQWRSRFRHFELKKNLEKDAISLEEYQSLFKLIAHRIEHFVIHLLNPSILLCFEFPVLRKLECYFTFNEGKMQVLAAHCPLIEELHFHGTVFGNPWPHIVRMRHLTELCVHSFSMFYDSRLVAEALIGASKLRILRMHYSEYTPGLMKSIVDLASTTELRDPLTVYINFGRDVYKTPYYNESHEDYYTTISFREYKQTLEMLIEKQLPSSKYTIIISLSLIEYRFFCQSNKK